MNRLMLEVLNRGLMTPRVSVEVLQLIRQGFIFLIFMFKYTV